MTDRELLEQLAGFINQRIFIRGDEKSLHDMVNRYGNAPLTWHYRIAMRLTVMEFRRLNTLMQIVNDHLQSTLHSETQTANDH